MIGAVGMDLDGDEVELSFRRPPLNERSGMPILLAIGDHEAGPFVGLFYDAPSTPEELAGPVDLTPAHSHPCDNFRIVMKGELWVGQERYHHGEFRLQRSGRPYGADGDAPHVDGCWRVISFADRRGHRVRPTNQELRKQFSSPEAMQSTRDRMGDLLPVLLPDEDDGVQGLVTTIDLPFSKLGHIDASMGDGQSWDEVGDGARIAVTVMGHHEVGPVYIVQHTPAGQLATPAMTFGSDVFRCVIAGTAEAGERTLEMGDTLTKAGGVAWNEVIAGPDGLDELIVIGDRRGATATVTGRDNGWAEYLATTVARLLTGLDALAGV